MGMLETNDSPVDVIPSAPADPSKKMKAAYQARRESRRQARKEKSQEKKKKMKEILYHKNVPQERLNKRDLDVQTTLEH